MEIILSIIVPVYNVASTLEACIDSIMTSTFQDFEVLLVDDGSTDGSSLLCDQLAEKYDKIKVFHTKNCGVSMARNLAMDHAKGKYIGFVNSDDLIAPDMYEALVSKMADDVQLVCCRFHKCKREDVVPLERTETSHVRIGEEIAEQILCNYYGAYVWSKLFNREVLDVNRIRFKPGCLMEDQYFIADYLRVCNKAVFWEDAFYYYIDTPGSITNTFRENRFVSEKYMALPRAHAYTAQIMDEMNYAVCKWSEARAAMFFRQCCAS